MSITVHYSSTRGEIWRFYRQLWKERLWKSHLAIFVTIIVFGSFGAFGRLPRDVSELVIMSLIAVIPIALLAFYPMLMFKPQRRTLTVDECGITTTIGRHQNKSVAWAEISEVQGHGDALVIQRRNLNAFIVPGRAFSSLEEKRSFEELVRANAVAR